MRRRVRTKHTEKADRPEPGLCVKSLPPSSHWPLRQPRCGLSHPLTARARGRVCRSALPLPSPGRFRFGSAVVSHPSLAALGWLLFICCQAA